MSQRLRKIDDLKRKISETELELKKLKNQCDVFEKAVQLDPQGMMKLFLDKMLKVSTERNVIKRIDFPLEYCCTTHDCNVFTASITSLFTLDEDPKVVINFV